MIDDPIGIEDLKRYRKERKKWHPGMTITLCRQGRRMRRKKLANELDISLEDLILLEKGKKNITVMIAHNLSLIFDIPSEEFTRTKQTLVDLIYCLMYFHDLHLEDLFELGCDYEKHEILYNNKKLTDDQCRQLANRFCVSYRCFREL
jgi:DNA-binding XRE family transcriptional regulator